MFSGYSPNLIAYLRERASRTKLTLEVIRLATTYEGVFRRIKINPAWTAGFMRYRATYFLALALALRAGFLGALTASLKALPAENLGTIAAGILISTPVEGLRPVRA